MSMQVQRNMVQHSCALHNSADSVSPQAEKGVLDIVHRENQRKRQIALSMVTLGYIKMTLHSAWNQSAYIAAPNVDLSITKRQFDQSALIWKKELHTFESLSFQRNEPLERQVQDIQRQILTYCDPLSLSDSLRKDLSIKLKESLKTVFLESEENSQRSSSVLSDISSASATNLSEGHVTTTTSKSDSDWEELRQAINTAVGR